MAEGYLFTYNPSTGTFDYFVEKFSDIDYSNVSSTTLYTRDANLVIGHDGYVYGTVHADISSTTGRLFRNHPTTKNITLLTNNAGYGSEADEFGNLYYYYENNLKRYAY
jgi:hypothetical protein